jgi:Crp-like helix-turn-helix domain
MKPDDASRVPWCWQDKRALRRIREQVEDHASALALYLALTEQASNSTSPQFTASHAQLAALSGLSIATVKRRLPELRRAGAIDYSTPRLREPSEFRLLPADPSAPADPAIGCRLLAHRERTKAHNEPAIAHESAAPRATLEGTEGTKNVEASSSSGGLMADYQAALRRSEEGASR